MRIPPGKIKQNKSEVCVSSLKSGDVKHLNMIKQWRTPPLQIGLHTGSHVLDTRIYVLNTEIYVLNTSSHAKTLAKSSWSPRIHPRQR